MAEQTNAISSKVWGMCQVLRDDGVTYGDFLEQLTYLIFLKMADEYAKPPYRKDMGIPEGYRWSDMNTLKGAELEEKYKSILDTLGQKTGILGKIFKQATNKISNIAILYRVIQMIDAEKWVSMSADVKGTIYEELLQKNAEDVKAAVLIIVGVLTSYLTKDVGEVILAMIGGAAVHLNGAVFVVLGHGLGGRKVLIPGPLGGQLAQTGLFPGSHVDGNIVAQTAAGEGVDALIQLEGVGAPVGNQIDAFFFNQISQLLIQAGFPALVNVGQAEGSQNVHFARHDGGVNGQVAVGVVVVGVQGNLDVGVHGVEVRDQSIHALRALEGHPEGDVAGDGSVFFQNPAGVQAFSASCEHGQQHDDRQEKRDEFLHGVVLLFISYDRMAPTINSNLERSKSGQNEI